LWRSFGSSPAIHEAFHILNRYSGSAVLAFLRVAYRISAFTVLNRI
jgi:hypothetical protein